MRYKSWQLKEVGARYVEWAIRKELARVMTDIKLRLGLDEGEMGVVEREIGYYLERAGTRCPHLSGINMSDFAAALATADRETWSSVGPTAKR